jgi:hypothetical protein
MLVSILEMNGEKISRSLNYLPSGKNYYNVVAKGHPLVKCSTAESTLEAVKKFEDMNVDHVYIKVPAALAGVELSNLRIA